jgi:hypothetical protein
MNQNLFRTKNHTLKQGFSTFFVSRNILDQKKFPRNKIKKSPSEVVCFYFKKSSIRASLCLTLKIENEVVCFSLFASSPHDSKCFCSSYRKIPLLIPGVDPIQIFALENGSTHGTFGCFRYI